MTEMTMLEKAARAIASALGDNLDDAFTCKGEWNQERGEKGGRFRDVNEPFRGDYFDAARAVLKAIREPDSATVERGYEGDVWGFPAPLFTAMIDHIIASGNEDAKTAGNG